MGKKGTKLPPPPTFTFWLLFHFSRGQNRESGSSVFLCFETKRKRLLRRLEISIYLNHMTNVFLQNHYHSRKAWNEITLQRRLYLFSPTFPVFALSFPLTARTINKVQKVNSQHKPNKTIWIISSTHTLASSCSNLDISCLLEVWKTIFAHQMIVFPSNVDTRESSHFNAV